MPNGTPATRKQPRIRSEKRQGMTLIEVLISLTIFTMAVVWTCSALMTSIAANRMTNANITANAAILATREEVQMVARSMNEENSSANLPDAVINFYSRKVAKLGEKSGDDGIAVGPSGDALAKIEYAGPGWVRKGANGNGAIGLLYTFAVPGPMEAVDTTDDPNQLYKRGYGEMLIYLDEESVPTGGADTIFWTDLGQNALTEADRTAVEKGFDMNADGKITKGGIMVNEAVLSPQGIVGNPADAKIKSLPIDITIKYFRDPGHKRHYLTATRRVMVTGVGNLDAIKATYN